MVSRNSILYLFKGVHPSLHKTILTQPEVLPRVCQTLPRQPLPSTNSLNGGSSGMKHLFGVQPAWAFVGSHTDPFLQQLPITLLVASREPY